MNDRPMGKKEERSLSDQEILELTDRIDFSVVDQRVKESTEDFRARHRVTQEKLELEISI